MLRSFGALPTELRTQEMTDRDYLWCALNMALDEEEELAKLCPSCRMGAEEQRCPVCGISTQSDGVGENLAFDMARFEGMRRVENP